MSKINKASEQFGDALVENHTITAPVDPRFATTVNQAKHCWTLYNEYLRCSKAQGGDNDQCQEIWEWTRSMCPGSWVCFRLSYPPPLNWFLFC